MKYATRYTLYALTALSIVSAFSASAHGRFPTQLVPEGCNVSACALCELWHLADHIINFLLFELAFPILVVALLIGGLIWLTSAGNPQGIERGKKLIVNGIIGILIAFGAWIIVGTIISTIANGSFSGAWNSVTCTLSQAGAGGSSGGGQPPGTTPPPTTPPVPPPPGGGATESETQARQTLSNAGITVNKNPCPPGVKYQDVVGGCTSLEGVKQSTLNGIINFKNECPSCTVLITGGTELGHTPGVISHQSGNKLDINPNTQLDSYVQNKYQPIGQCFPAASACFRSPTGQIWARESNHWDVAFP
ncbi:TrbC/VirB2 family protein [Candidatus Giovannonibacteria bacterium]|nr:TrbC/VirB2 family protein [Candidatus Giovannonibacteria bacterium]